MADFTALDADHFTRQGAYTRTIHRDTYPAIDPSAPHLAQTGKIIIITGAGSGIGARGLAPSFAQAGARALVLVGRRAANLDAVAADLHAQYPGVEVVPVAADVASAEAVEAVFETVRARFGRAADVLVNNAGAMAAPSALSASEPAAWWRAFTTNAFGTYLMTRAFVRALPPDARATVVNFTSGAATVIVPGMSGYGMSKMVAARIGEYIAVEHPNVACVALDPGTVETDMVFDTFRKFARDTPALVGGMSVWLATPAAAFLSGRVVMANWDVDELVQRRAEIEIGSDLKMVLQGTFGDDVLS